MPLPPRPLISAQCPARPPKGRGLAGAPGPLSRELSLALGHEAWGPVSLIPSPPDHTQRGQGPRRRPRRAQHPSRTPAFPSLAPHDLVLVHDELVYIFQIKLVRHGAAAWARSLRAPHAATAAAPAGGKPLFPHPDPGSFPTATEATRYGGRRRVKLSLRDGAGRSRRS